MNFLGADVDAARVLAGELRSAALGVEPIISDVSHARLIAELPLPVDGLLDEIRYDCLASAARIERAVAIIESFHLVFPGLRWQDRVSPPSTDVDDVSQLVPLTWTPQQARWDGGPATPWNQLHQESSHNSYDAAIGVLGLYDLGIRSFELDIHRGAPTDFTPRPTLLWDVPVDHVTHAGGREDDWWVYHTSFDPDSEYESLRQGLEAIADLPATDPLTIFIDVKDAFTDEYSPQLLDELLDGAFGDRLFVPADVMARSPGAPSLQASMTAAGWPTVEELHTRVIVVLTGMTADYSSAHPQAFVAEPPVFSTNEAGMITHLADPSIIFYNQVEHLISSEEVAAVSTMNGLIRTYGHSGCPAADEVRPHYRVMDIEPDDPRCAN